MSQNEPFTAPRIDAPLLATDNAASNGTITSNADCSGLLKAITAKSLFMCLAVDNPFDPKDREERVVDETRFSGQPATTLNPAAFLKDDDYLLVPDTGKKCQPFSIAISRPGAEEPVVLAPTKFQKIIEMLLRFEKRGLDVRPHNMLKKVDPGSDQAKTPNYFHGYMLVEEQLLTSPDRDEIYLKIHASSNVLYKFAEFQGIPLVTNEMSFAGGAALPYSNVMERRLAESVDLYHVAYGCDPLYLDKAGSGFGFWFEVPHKMRVLIRLMREAWKYGGCGIQINELRKSKTLVRHFFPLHNQAYLKDKDLNKWASIQQLFSCSPLFQEPDNLVLYFGEEVAMYFVWIREMTLFLRWLAVPGVICGVLGKAGVSISIVNGAFGIVCCIWSSLWMLHWGRCEEKFSTWHNQEDQMQQEMVRDEFVPLQETKVEYKDIYGLTFDYPLSMQHQTDGTMINLYYPHARRLLIRYLISYPIIMILTAMMIAVLVLITWWRFSDPDNFLITYGSSIATVMVSVLFGMMFEKAVSFLNERENNRTELEEQNENITKSFFFYFFSYYFALFILALWPIQGTDISRLQQLEAQMIIITIIKPMIQNIQELLVPYIKTQLRRRTDLFGSVGAALKSMLQCQPLPQRENRTDNDKEGEELWMEAQLEPYESTAGDYLEITLQFGYMAMFASTFPWAAIAAFLYNALEIRVDARKLVYFCQRTVAKPTTSIGAWKNIFWILTVLSLVTNSYFITILSPAVKKLTLPDSAIVRWQAFAVYQYILVFVMAILFAMVGRTPLSTLKTKAKRQMLANKAVREKMRELMQEMALRKKGGPGLVDSRGTFEKTQK